MTEVLAVCPCGADFVFSRRRRKFCSRSCAGKFGGGRASKATYCPRCGWTKDAENTYSNGSCRRCTLAQGRADYVPGSRGTPKPRAQTAPVSPKPGPREGQARQACPAAVASARLGAGTAHPEEDEMTTTEEWPRGTRVTKPGWGYTGTVHSWETKFRTRWCVVSWDGRPFTEREYPHSLERIES